MIFNKYLLPKILIWLLIYYMYNIYVFMTYTNIDNIKHYKHTYYI